MPELPEVETIRRGLTRLKGRQLTGVEIHDPRLLRNCSPAELEGLRGRLRGVARRGKFLILHLDEHALVLHLGMTGRLLLPPHEGRHTHTRLVLHFGGEKPELELELVLDDPRRFATLHCVRSIELDGFEPLRRLGIEPFTPSYTLENFRRVLRTKREIKRLLLDQRKLAGLGNIYANEALFRAEIDPRRPANSLSCAEARKLFEVIPRLLEEAIAAQGTTISDYRTATGESGRFQELLQVYGRDFEPCRRCGSRIERIEQAGRSTFFCPGCQR